ncbi:MAG: hypothetical protein OXN84_02740, partial [Albidovulum sp.]|nr:hypothetical protein [Albidovulum sp.]
MIALAPKRRTIELRGGHWLAAYGLILLSWTALFALHLSVSDLQGLKAYGFDYFWELCTLGPEDASFAVVAGMWAAMSAAMMLPGFIPALSTFDNLIGAGADNKIAADPGDLFRAHGPRSRYETIERGLLDQPDLLKYHSIA